MGGRVRAAKTLFLVEYIYLFFPLSCFIIKQTSNRNVA